MNYHAVPLARTTNLETEQRLLGLILWQPERLSQVKTVLKPVDFHYEKHRTMFQAMLNIDKQNLPIDIFTLWDFLKETGELDKVGGSSYLTYLCQIIIGEQIKKDSEETDQIIGWLQREIKNDR